MIKNLQLEKTLDAFCLFFKRLTSEALSLVESVKLFAVRSWFRFICYKIGIKTTKKQFQVLWNAKNLTQWLKTGAHLAFYPKGRIKRRVWILEKRTKQYIHRAAIGPGSEFLSWFQDLHVDSDCNRKKVSLTPKQVSFVYALSDKLCTYSPETIFQMLNSYWLVDAWFTIAKVLADRPFDKLEVSFETLSDKMDYPIDPEDLLNYETMRVWLENTIKEE